jgi:hypothetical protein
LPVLRGPPEDGAARRPGQLSGRGAGWGRPSAGRHAPTTCEGARFPRTSICPHWVPKATFHRRDTRAVRPLRAEVWAAKEEDAHGHSRPKAVTGRGLPPNVLYERWPSASNPQSTLAPVASGGVWAAASSLRTARPVDPPQTRP